MKCAHDFHAVLFCHKCQATYDIGMVEIINQAKIDTANHIVQELKKYLDKGTNIESALDNIIFDFQRDMRESNAEVTIMGMKNKDTRD